MKKRFLLQQAAFLALAMGISSAHAADYEPLIVPEEPVVLEEYQPVEIGSGWYIRADIGYSITTGFRDRSSAGTIGGVPTQFDESTNAANGSVAVGYHINDIFRTEVEFGFVHSSRFGGSYAASCGGTEIVTRQVIDPLTGQPVTEVVSGPGPSTRPCTGRDSGQTSIWDGLVNVYADLGTVAGFTPYVGAGLGLAYTKTRAAVGDKRCLDQSNTVGGATTSFICHGSNGTGATYSGFATGQQKFSLAWALNAGVSYDLTQNSKLDLGYRYLSMPGTPTLTNTGSGTLFGTGMDSHEIRVGLRYELW